MNSLRKLGLSYKQIASNEGISRRRVEYILTAKKGG